MNQTEHEAEVERIRAEHDGWVPVGLLEPNATCPYQTTDNGGSVSDVWFDADIEEWNCVGYVVIAWQPLPKPYQPKGES